MGEVCEIYTVPRKFSFAMCNGVYVKHLMTVTYNRTYCKRLVKEKVVYNRKIP